MSMVNFLVIGTSSYIDVATTRKFYGTKISKLCTLETYRRRYQSKIRAPPLPPPKTEHCSDVKPCNKPYLCPNKGKRTFRNPGFPCMVQGGAFEGDVIESTSEYRGCCGRGRLMLCIHSNPGPQEAVSKMELRHEMHYICRRQTPL